MAKLSKKQKVTFNPRSRAAKRATSPSINVDKSLKDAPRALGTDPTLGVMRDSGVVKKKKANKKNMTRGQRARQEKGLARAEAVMDQMEKKIDGAKSKLKKMHSRKALWEDINESTAEEQRKTVRTPGRVSDLEDVKDQDDGFETEENENEEGDLGEVVMKGSDDQVEKVTESTIGISDHGKLEAGRDVVDEADLIA